MKIEELKNYFLKRKKDWELTEDETEYIQYKNKLNEKFFINIEISLENEMKNINRIEIVHPFISFGCSDNVYEIRRPEDIINFVPILEKFYEEDPYLLKIRILENYIKILKFFKEKYDPILIKYNFSLKEDKIYTYESDNSTPAGMWWFDYSNKDCDCTIRFYYDSLTEELTSPFLELPSNLKEFEDILIMTSNEFEEYLRYNFAGNANLEYLVSSDPKHTSESFKVICFLSSEISRMERGKSPNDHLLKDINFEHLPKRYEDLFEKYNNLRKNFNL